MENKHIELVKKWLADKNSVSQEELATNSADANAEANVARATVALRLRLLLIAVALLLRLLLMKLRTGLKDTRI